MATELLTKKYNVRLIGKTALLMHKDNILFSERISQWRKDPQNKNISVSGDDRSPAWTWTGYLYTDSDIENNELSKKLIIDSDNIMTMLREAGAKISTGKGKQTYKTISQTGIQVLGNFNFYNRNEEVKTDWIQGLIGENNFDVHTESVKDHGFILNLKRAKIGTGPRASKHIRVRPQFDHWSAEGIIQISDEETSGISQEILIRMLQLSGDIIGLCDWRPSSPNAGPYGRFDVEVERIQ